MANKLEAEAREMRGMMLKALAMAGSDTIDEPKTMAAFARKKLEEACKATCLLCGGHPSDNATVKAAELSSLKWRYQVEWDNGNVSWHDCEAAKIRALMGDEAESREG